MTLETAKHAADIVERLDELKTAKYKIDRLSKSEVLADHTELANLAYNLCDMAERLTNAILADL